MIVNGVDQAPSQGSSHLRLLCIRPWANTTDDSHGGGQRKRLRKVGLEHTVGPFGRDMVHLDLAQPFIATGYKQGQTRYESYSYWTWTSVMDDDFLVAVANSEQGQSWNTSHGRLETLFKVFISLNLISNFPGPDQFRGPCPGVSRTSPSPRLYPSLFHSCTGFLSARTAYRAIPAGS